MRAIGKRLSYANVVSTLALFLVLCGGAAFAASKIGKRSVGAPQLKSNAVTTAKIKANAVTTRKIKKEAISTDKLKNGSVNTEKVNLADLPFGRIVSRMRGSGNVALEKTLKLYPLASPTYNQAANEVDSYVGAVDVTFQSSCEPPRTAAAYILVDSPNPTSKEAESEIASLGEVSDTGTGTVNKKIQISPFFVNGVSFEPGAAKGHTVSLVAVGECKAATTGITATTGAVDVLGTR
jgi:hypothetical protein